MFKWLKLFWNIWPDLMSLFKHVKANLPSEDHAPAIKHALNEAKEITTSPIKNIPIVAYTRTQDNIDNLENFEDE